MQALLPRDRMSGSAPATNVKRRRLLETIIIVIVIADDMVDNYNTRAALSFR